MMKEGDGRGGVVWERGIEVAVEEKSDEKKYEEEEKVDDWENMREEGHKSALRQLPNLVPWLHSSRSLIKSDLSLVCSV